ncbi:hypothetical protein F5Y17DRAFT_432402 [Xylariaceae sp. FL0594]|nr:hypothetical protein F5Y17DRAFT_432402 [Xylariaceae sp. FL0594]
MATNKNTTIRIARPSDADAIFAIETASFPHANNDADHLAHILKNGSAENWQTLVLEDVVDGKKVVQGVLLLRSYLKTEQECHIGDSGEPLTLPANPLESVPWSEDTKMLTTALVYDEALEKEEVLHIFELAIDPSQRRKGHGTKLARLITHDIAKQVKVQNVKVIVFVEGTIEEAKREYEEELLKPRKDGATVVDDAEGGGGSEEVKDGNDGKGNNGDDNEAVGAMSFYRDILGFKARSRFFHGRKGSDTPHVFWVMEYVQA